MVLPIPKNPAGQPDHGSRTTFKAPISMAVLSHCPRPAKPPATRGKWGARKQPAALLSHPITLRASQRPTQPHQCLAQHFPPCCCRGKCHQLSPQGTRRLPFGGCHVPHWLAEGIGMEKAPHCFLFLCYRGKSSTGMPSANAGHGKTHCRALQCPKSATGAELRGTPFMQSTAPGCCSHCQNSTGPNLVPPGTQCAHSDALS